MMVTFIDQHRDTYGVKPICAVLPIAPSTYFGPFVQLQMARWLTVIQDLQYVRRPGGDETAVSPAVLTLRMKVGF